MEPDAVIFVFERWVVSQHFHSPLSPSSKRPFSSSLLSNQGLFHLPGFTERWQEKGKVIKGSFLKPSGSTWPLPPWWLFMLLTLCVSPSGAHLTLPWHSVHREKLFPQFLTGKTGLIHVCILPSSCLKTILCLLNLFSVCFLSWCSTFTWPTGWNQGYFSPIFLLLLSIPFIMPSCSRTSPGYLITMPYLILSTNIYR